ncbi:MAG: rhomboid family intramembrane serine protease [PVC group bacterium]|nr:rhomboid family intramembrane serine protease [PVC group bacterium]
MIPLRDSNPSRSMPVVTVLLIIINIAIFMRGIFLGPEFKSVFYSFAVIPNSYLDIQWMEFNSVWESNRRLISALFLHGGWLHLLGNMWYLWIFGDNVEDRLGPVRFLFFYILCGVAGNLAHIFMNTHSTVPAVGASGCIAGVLGAYFLMFPGARIVTVLPIFIFWTVAEVRAFFFLGIWFAIQFLNGFFTLPGGKNISGIAWWAHIGGFIAGIILTFILAGKSRGRRKKVRF